MANETDSVHLDLSVPEAVAAFRLLLALPRLGDGGEASLFRKLEGVLHGVLSIEEMEALAGGQGRG